MSNNPLCPCGSMINFSSCCNRLLQREHHAQTAEQLMRSRYCAFYTYNVDYLLDTHHPSRQSANEKQELIQTINQNQWLQLTILNTQNGLKKDKSGTVEFIAVYTNTIRSPSAAPSITDSSPTVLSESDYKTKTLNQLREVSNFVKENSRWFYLDGDIIDSTTGPLLKLNRNSPCWCGSGKKFKKCHA